MSVAAAQWELTVGAASSNMTAQVVALFPSLSEITPAKIPPVGACRCPTQTHKYTSTHIIKRGDVYIKFYTNHGAQNYKKILTVR